MFWALPLFLPSSCEPSRPHGRTAAGTSTAGWDLASAVWVSEVIPAEGVENSFGGQLRRGCVSGLVAPAAPRGPHAAPTRPRGRVVQPFGDAPTSGAGGVVAPRKRWPHPAVLARRLASVAPFPRGTRGARGEPGQRL